MMLQRQFAEAADRLDDATLPNEGWEKTIANVYRLWAAAENSTPKAMREQLLISLVRVAGSDHRNARIAAGEALAIYGFLFPDNKLDPEDFIAAVEAWKRQAGRGGVEVWLSTTSVVDPQNEFQTRSDSLRKLHERFKADGLGAALERLIRPPSQQ
jgi:hypothetical protein